MRKMTFEVYRSTLLSSVRVGGVAQAFALAQEAATYNQTDLHCFQSCRDSRETVVTLDTVARTPQSHEHALVLSCIGASLLLSTIVTFKRKKR